MARIKRKDRQRIIDDYMSAVGVDVFVARDFLGWLSSRPDHECYELFFGLDETEAAARYREDLVRKWTSDLRIRVAVSTAPGTGRSVRAVVQEFDFPAMYSPMDARRSGGGYRHTDISEADCLDSLRAEAAASLLSWLDRYEGVLAASGIKVAPIHRLVSGLQVTAQKVAAE